ncbi:MAG: signal peptidase I [Nakamurella sp.]
MTDPAAELPERDLGREPGRVRRQARRRGALAAAVVVLGVVVARTQLIDLLTVSSDSMSPTLCVGDTVVLTRLPAGSDINHDDIVTFRDPDSGAEAIKRVVGLAGEKVSIEDAQLTIDGRPIDEPWVDHRTIDGVYFGPVTVPAGAVFLMGDHREVSIDSRHFGAVAIGDLDGRLLTSVFGGCG